MALMSYKCPNCGGGLVFDPDSQKFQCEYCLSEFTEEEMKQMEEASASPAEEEEAVPEEEGTAPQEGDSSQSPETGEAAVYTCPNCGAQIVTDATTAASFCYYCHNPVVFSGRLSGDHMPDFVIPFAIDKKEATSRFLSWIGKKKFVPGDFFSRDQIEKLSGIYFPYLIYSCQVDGQAEAEAEEQRTWVSGRTRYTEHKRYQVERAGTLEVKNLTRNALKKSNKELVEGVLPFDMEKLLPFQMGYLSGFQAERRDMDEESFADEAEQEVKQYTLDRLRSSMDTYSSVRIKDSSMEIRDPRWQYALLPVWVMTYGHRAGGKTYYFAMNGQTGKIWGRLPVDKRKLAGLFFGVFFPVFAALMIGGWVLWGKNGWESWAWRRLWPLGSLGMPGAD